MKIAFLYRWLFTWGSASSTPTSSSKDRWSKPMTCCLVMLALSLSARADVDLTPMSSVRVLEGHEFPQILFADGVKKISYECPKGWRYVSSGPGKIRFNPGADGKNVIAEIEAVPLAQPFSFDQEGTKTLREETLRQIPKESQQIDIVSEELNSFSLCGHETYAVTVSFVQFGRRYRMSMLFANGGNQQLRFKCLGYADDFDAALRLFRGSLFSWQWL